MSFIPPFNLLGEILGPSQKTRDRMRADEIARSTREDMIRQVLGQSYAPPPEPGARGMLQNLGSALTLGIVPRHERETSPFDATKLTPEQRTRMDQMTDLQQRLIQARDPRAFADIITTGEIYAPHQPMTDAGKLAWEVTHGLISPEIAAMTSAQKLSPGEASIGHVGPWRAILGGGEPPPPDALTGGGIAPTPFSPPPLNLPPAQLTNSPLMTTAQAAPQIPFTPMQAAQPEQAAGAPSALEPTVFAAIPSPQEPIKFNDLLWPDAEKEFTPASKKRYMASVAAGNPDMDLLREMPKEPTEPRKVVDLLWPGAEKEFTSESLQAFAESASSGVPNWKALQIKPYTERSRGEGPSFANRIAFREGHEKVNKFHNSRVDAMRPIFGIMGFDDTQREIPPYLNNLVNDVTGGTDRTGRRLSASAARDIALIFAYMRANDPTSVVRESEQQTAINARSKFGAIGAMYNRLMTGELLTDEQRQDLIETAADMTRTSVAAIDANDREYARIGRIEGYDPESLRDSLKGIRQALLGPDHGNPFLPVTDQPSAAGVAQPAEGQVVATADDIKSAAAKIRKDGGKPTRASVRAALKAGGFTSVDEAENAKFLESFPE